MANDFLASGSRDRSSQLLEDKPRRQSVVSERWGRVNSARENTEELMRATGRGEVSHRILSPDSCHRLSFYLIYNAVCVEEGGVYLLTLLSL
ncbi:hypothetical protein ElyMa_006279600 [Elysia marginata]|uniref:Uncharacterized protein n=1 Tax=Elysia marginata TaxID=1093978 RepID=A0AAV4HDD6_9GAST|nr:hypothetical protein ElyMa_006279600 [Elysia marginata]